MATGSAVVAHQVRLVVVLLQLVAQTVVCDVVDVADVIARTFLVACVVGVRAEERHLFEDFRFRQAGGAILFVADLLQARLCLLQLLGGFLVHAQATPRGDERHHHDDERYVEGEQRADDDEDGVLRRADSPLTIEHGVVVEEAHDDDWRADGERQRPHERDLQRHHGARAVAAELHGVADGEVAVHRHGAHVPDRRRAQQHVHGDVDDAHALVEPEVACNTAKFTVQAVLALIET